MKGNLFFIGFIGLILSCTPQKKVVITVNGGVEVSSLGKTLIHEHIATDFIGAEKVKQPQYEQTLAVATILPHLKQLKAQGFTTLVECTPNHIGRDVKLLKELAELSGLNIMTNTGYYAAVDKKYLPRHAYEEEAPTISKRWEREWLEGIDGTDIKPGFIKLGVGKGKLDEIEEKLLLAGVLLSKKSGLPIYVHTGDGEAARSEYEIIRRAGLPSDRLVWVHAQNGKDEDRIALAQKGVWISLDGVKPKQLTKYVEMIRIMKANNLLHRLLISHDDGWSVVNQEGTISLTPFRKGNTAPYLTVQNQLIPELLKIGFTRKEIDQLLTVNPAKALTLKAKLLE